MKIAAICLAAVLFVAHSSTLDAADPAEEYRQAVLAAEKQCQDAIAEARTKYVMALTEAMTAETQKGDLDAAIAIRDEIKSLQNQPTESNIIMENLAGTDWLNTNNMKLQWKKDGRFFWNGNPTLTVQIDSHRLVMVAANSIKPRIPVIVFNDDFTVFELWWPEDREKPSSTGKRVPAKR